ncbi:ATP F0F1 synthase subunit B [Halovulum dunhuangense]|uniref:ATP synthase subunit b n=2 Tax=Halovulum dunhuangense TaxID=1505036 RepID=A0A849L088_9RHOB|nr:ATP F0F1 synthase subunit B [Halovulum dunhuangense]
MATGPFFSLDNTDFVVLLGFLIFVGVLLYFGVPKLITSKLDARAEEIRNELDEARTMREDAQSLLAEFEKRKEEVSDQAASIVAAAKSEGESALAAAKADLEATMARRLNAATEQIASAEQAAVREVRDRAVAVAVKAAAEVIAQKMNATQADALIDKAIAEVKGKLH